MNKKIAPFAAALLLSAPVLAQTFPIKFTGQHSSHFKGKTRVAIGSYGINFVVAQKGTAVAGVGLSSRMATGLQGVDEATMRRLANEAYADLKAQLAAAGVALASEAEVRGVLAQAGVALLPGNSENHRDGGITIGKSVKKASVAYGADAAPLTNLFPAAGKTSAFSMMGSVGKIGKLNAPGKALDAVLIFPLLTVDYADTEAKVSRTLTGAKRGTVETNVAFGVRTQSLVNVVNPGYTWGSFYPAKDVFVDAPFSRGATEMAAKSDDSAYLMNVVRQEKEGDVVVDPVRWTALVQAAYRAYNAAIVATVREMKAKG